MKRNARYIHNQTSSIFYYLFCAVHHFTYCSHIFVECEPPLRLRDAKFFLRREHQRRAQRGLGKFRRQPVVKSKKSRLRWCINLSQSTIPSYSLLLFPFLPSALMLFFFVVPTTPLLPTCNLDLITNIGYVANVAPIFAIAPKKNASKALMALVLLFLLLLLPRCFCLKVS